MDAPLAGFLLLSLVAQPDAFFRADAKVVLINASVLDHNHRPVRGLTRDHFRLFENRVEQRISYFGEEEMPLSLAIVFDTSGSMEGKTAGAGLALGALLKHSGDQDEFSLITFADRPELEVGWTSDAVELQNRVAFTHARGRTALLDAIDLALAQLHTARNPRKAVLILSDGGDNHSRHSERRIAGILAEADAQLYALDMSAEAVPRGRSAEEIMGPDLLDRLCSRAGGRYWQVENQPDLEHAADQIGKEMRSQYVLGYAPSNPAPDGLFRHVRLQLLPSRSGFAIYWRRGYRAPAP